MKFWTAEFGIRAGAILAATVATSLMPMAVTAADGDRANAGRVELAQYNDAYRPPRDDGRYEPGGGGGSYRDDRGGGASSADTYRPPQRDPRVDDAYRPPSSGEAYGDRQRDGGGRFDSGDGGRYGGDRTYSDRGVPPSGGYGEPYAPPPAGSVGDDTYRGDRAAEGRDYYDDRGPRRDRYEDDAGSPDTYSQSEIVAAGHSFFGSITQGLARVIEYAFRQAGRPNGYILGEDASGAFVAGLRYGEGRLYTKNAGTHRVYWQGPSLGYDFGGAGAKTMVLVYNLRDPEDIYNRFGGVEGSAYLVGGVSIQFQKHADVTMAPIRAGVGLRLGANVGYLKYTRKPTWNPF